MRKDANEKQKQLRELIVNGNMLKAAFIVILPLILYNYSNYLYGIFDTLTVSINNIGSVDDIIILTQIKDMIGTLGGAFTIGGVIILARKYGSGRYEDAKITANNLYFSSLILSVALILIFIPFGIPLLKLLSTPDEVINNSINYYYVQIVGVAIGLMNSTFIAIEKAKGSTKKIMYLNLGVVFIKVFLTSFFVYSGFFSNVTVTYLAVATVIANLVLFVYSTFILFSKNNIFQISFKYFKYLSFSIIKPIVVMAVPIFIGKFLFSFGKVFVNSQTTTFYGKAATGALGVSNTIAGAVTNFNGSIEDGTATIISQNLGNNQEKRAHKFFNIALIMSITLSTIGFILLTIFAQQISSFFAPNDIAKQQMIYDINYYERFSIILSAVEGAAFGLLYGYGKSKPPMVVSMLKLFAFRIPALLFMYHVLNFGYFSTGVAMSISNGFCGLIAFVIAIIFLFKRKKQIKIDKVSC